VTSSSQYLYLLPTLLRSKSLLASTDFFFFGMPPRSFAKLLALIFLLASTSSVYVQAAVIPALGDEGTPAIGDIQRLSIADRCGDLDITQNLDTSTADTSGAFPSPIVVNLNLYVHRPRPFVTGDWVS
jgi:hypothetical protein